MTGWSVVEHLPTRKLMVVFDGSNGAEIAALVGNPTKCEWDGWQLTVHNSQGEFRVHPGDPILYEFDGSEIYAPPEYVVDRQYKVIGQYHPVGGGA